MKRFIFDVTTTVQVVLDETKFTPQFLEEYRRYFYQFNTTRDHAAHLAELAARELLHGDWLEGYGQLADLGIKTEVIETETEFVYVQDEEV